MSYELTIEYGDDVLLSTALSRSEFDYKATFRLDGKRCPESGSRSRTSI